MRPSMGGCRSCPVSQNCLHPKWARQTADGATHRRQAHITGQHASPRHGNAPCWATAAHPHDCDRATIKRTATARTYPHHPESVRCYWYVCCCVFSPGAKGDRNSGVREQSRAIRLACRPPRDACSTRHLQCDKHRHAYGSEQHRFRFRRRQYGGKHYHVPDPTRATYHEHRATANCADPISTQHRTAIRGDSARETTCANAYYYPVYWGKYRYHRSRSFPHAR